MLIIIIFVFYNISNIDNDYYNIDIMIIANIFFIFINKNNIFEKIFINLNNIINGYDKNVYYSNNIYNSNNFDNNNSYMYDDFIYTNNLLNNY
jgi:hypothetical protein